MRTAITLGFTDARAYRIHRPCQCCNIYFLVNIQPPVIAIVITKLALAVIGAD